MFLSAHEIAQSREHAMNNLLGLSSAWIDAGHRLSQAMTTASREHLAHEIEHLARFGQDAEAPGTLLPTSYWLAHTARASRLLEDALDIFGETQKAIIRCAEEQVRILDSVAIASINRASKTSPWETEVALSALKTSLQGAENTLRGMSEAAIGTVDLAEKEIHQMTAVLADAAPAPRKRPTASRSRARTS